MCFLFHLVSVTMVGFVYFTSSEDARFLSQLEVDIKKLRLVGWNGYVSPGQGDVEILSASCRKIQRMARTESQTMYGKSVCLGYLQIPTGTPQYEI